MSKLPFTHHLQSEYTPGKDLNLLPFELFNHVKAGRLHPFDKDTGQPIPRPDAQRIKKRLEEIKQEIKVLPLANGKIDALYRGQGKEDEKRKLELQAEALQKEHDPLSKELDAITDINDWTTYDPQENPKHLITHLPIDLMKAFDILQNTLFHNNEIRSLNIETPLPAQEEPGSMPPKSPAPFEPVTFTTEQPLKEDAPALKDEPAVTPVKENVPVISKEQAEEVIKAITVIHVSDTEIIIRHSDKEITAACGDMGFKSNAKPWKMFMNMLQDRNNQYFIGRYDKMNPDNNKDYRNKVKRFEYFSKNFIQFINDKFTLSLPDVNVFQNMKHQVHAGMYKPKFQVCEHQSPNRQVEIKSLSKEGTLERLTALLKQYEGEKNKAEKERILLEIGRYCDHAIKKHGIPEGELRSFLPSPDDTPSENDMMQLISEVTEKNKYLLS